MRTKMRLFSNRRSDPINTTILYYVRIIGRNIPALQPIINNNINNTRINA